MIATFRRAVVVASLVAVSAVSAEAQMMGGMKVEELRVSLSSFSSNDGGSTFGVSFPGSVAIAFYLNDQIAIEPMVGLTSYSPDVGNSFTMINVGVLVPYYFGTDRGVSGLFVAPGFNMVKVTDIDASTSIGAEFGYKKAWKEKISWRVAGTFWTNDGNSTIGANAGISMFWR